MWPFLPDSEWPIPPDPNRNKIYESGDNIIITRYSMQGMRIEQEDNTDGLEARELTENVFYVRKQ